jgi:hypothetical protein
MNRHHRDEELTAAVASALDSIYQRPVDVDTAFASLQSRIASTPRSRPHRARRRYRWHIAVAGGLAAAGLAAAAGIIMVAFLSGSGAGTATQVAASRPQPHGRHQPGAPTADAADDGAVISLDRLRPAAARAGHLSPRRTVVLNDHRVRALVATVDRRPGGMATATFVYHLGNAGSMQFSAVLPRRAGDRPRHARGRSSSRAAHRCPTRPSRQPACP